MDNKHDIDVMHPDFKSTLVAKMAAKKAKILDKQAAA